MLGPSQRQGCHQLSICAPVREVPNHHSSPEQGCTYTYSAFRSLVRILDRWPCTARCGSCKHCQVCTPYLASSKEGGHWAARDDGAHPDAKQHRQGQAIQVLKLVMWGELQSHGTGSPLHAWNVSDPDQAAKHNDGRLLRKLTRSAAAGKLG